MSRVLHDYVPAEMTAGEVAALGDANPEGWISPPLYNSLRPEPPRAWRSVHLRYLERRGLVGGYRCRPDGAWRVRLNRQGLALRDSMVTQ